MTESFSPVILLYGMAIILAVGKACTLFIWQALPKPRPPLRQEMIEVWRGWRTRIRASDVARPDPQGPASDQRPDVSASEASVADVHGRATQGC
ncbi:hypothetical protein MicloDRAFT_00004130 [Microvirga lotononidis]|uniref:Uncharacterized protein n=1 Tax=Microvirga lotononidis TaxID=864069 RepID=I4Z3U4_9HYPH|nr:hypothetical protein MicloDRAFT_00014750 [Microvirga lotononidis]EIM30886.1 hypothetical protein MicloDRAFT_00004130 [Microvirga lotononidis]